MMKSDDITYQHKLCVRTQSHKPHTWFKFFDEFNGRKLYSIKRNFSGFNIYNGYNQVVAKLNCNWLKTRYELFQQGNFVADIKYLYPIGEYHDIILYLRQQRIAIANIKPKKKNYSYKLKFDNNDYVASCKNFKMQSLEGNPSLEFAKLGDSHYRLSFNNNITPLVAVALTITRFFV